MLGKRTSLLLGPLGILLWVYGGLYSRIASSVAPPPRDHETADEKREEDSSAPQTPQGELCLADFKKDPRYFEDPELEPFLRQIEREQRKREKSMFDEAGSSDWTKLRKKFRDIDNNMDQTNRDASCRTLADWSLYLESSRQKQKLNRIQLDLTEILARNASWQVHQENPSIPWLTKLPIKGPKEFNEMGESADGRVNWDEVFTSESAAEALYEKLFLKKPEFPSAKNELEVWRQRAKSWHESKKKGDLTGYPTPEKLTYLELSLLKEHLLNVFEKSFGNGHCVRSR